MVHHLVIGHHQCEGAKGLDRKEWIALWGQLSLTPNPCQRVSHVRCLGPWQDHSVDHPPRSWQVVHHAVMRLVARIETWLGPLESTRFHETWVTVLESQHITNMTTGSCTLAFTNSSCHTSNSPWDSWHDFLQSDPKWPGFLCGWSVNSSKNTLNLSQNIQKSKTGKKSWYQLWSPS